MASNAPTTQVQKKDDIDIGAIVATGAINFVKQRPVSVSVWVLGLVVAAFATGFKVDEARSEAYTITLQHAEEVAGTELQKALMNYQRADQKHYNVKGWFGACDNKCAKALDQANMAKAEVNRVQAKHGSIVTEARREVGIWSTFGVQDVRNSFWSAWKSGKDFAARYTMMDAMFMMIGGKEETAASMMMKVFMQYLINLTMGLCGAFFYFIYNVYYLIQSYGEPMLSGVSFFLLVLVAGMATIGTYLFAIFGTVAGGGVYLFKKAQEQQRLEGQQGRRPRQVQGGGYGGAQGRPGGFGGPGGPGGAGGRSHYD